LVKLEIKKAIDKAGLNDPHVVKDKGGKVTIHTLRHTFASRLVQAGVSLAKVSKLLGHSSVTTTEIYAHLAPNEVSEKATKVLNHLLHAGERSLQRGRRRGGPNTGHNDQPSGLAETGWGSGPGAGYAPEDS
jgi:hypothetical protein